MVTSGIKCISNIHILICAGQADPPQDVDDQQQDANAQNTGADSPAAAALDEDAGWQEVTRQHKKPAPEPAPKFWQQATANLQPLTQPDVVLIPAPPKFNQNGVRLTPFPTSWSHTQIEQTSERYGKEFGYVLTTWSGHSNRGIPYGAVRFGKASSAKRMIASGTHGIQGAPRSLKFIRWEGKVPADVLGQAPAKAAGDAGSLLDGIF